MQLFLKLNQYMIRDQEHQFFLFYTLFPTENDLFLSYIYRETICKESENTHEQYFRTMISFRLLEFYIVSIWLPVNVIEKNR